MKTGYRSSRDLSLVFAAGLLLLTALACSIPFQSQGAPTSVPQQPAGEAPGACLPGIIPGTTTRDQLVSLLGEPLAVEPEGAFEDMLYSSPSQGQFNSVYIQDGVVVLVSIVTAGDSPLAWSAVEAQYGEPAHTTYSYYLQSAMTYIYPERGLAFIASQAPDIVYIRQCFAPMALDDYMTTWGQSLPAEDPFIR